MAQWGLGVDQMKRSIWLRYDERFPLAATMKLAQEAADTSGITQYVETADGMVTVEPNPTKLRLYRGK